MSLSDLAAIGSFVSGLAVVVTLVFLVIQMRQSNRNQRSLIQQGRSSRVIAAILNRTEPHVNESSIRGANCDLTMDAASIQLFIFTNYVLLVGWEDTFLQHQAGMVDVTSWRTDEARLRFFVARPSFRASWKMIRNQFVGPFRDFVDALMKEIQVLPPADLEALWQAAAGEELAAVEASRRNA